ncbi:hypothetical protein LLG95_13905 [bacterium]|nr:hypothetical protein [bacterium]
MDTFDVDKLMRYDHLKEQWESTIEREREKDKPPGTHARNETTEPPPATAKDPSPAPPSAPARSTVIASPRIETLRRGQRLEFVSGIRKWCAVYWGKDDEGHVIAHKTFKDWALMHLDLKEYLDKLSAESEPDHELVRSIEQCLAGYEKRAA